MGRICVGGSCLVGSCVGYTSSPNTCRPSARYVERADAGDPTAAVEMLGYVESLVERWRESL